MNLKNLKRTYQMLVKDPFKRWKEASKGAYFIKKAYILAPNNWADPKYGLVVTSVTASM